MKLRISLCLSVLSASLAYGQALPATASNYALKKFIIPGEASTEILAINNAGDLAGIYYDSNSTVEHGFLFRSGVLTKVDYPGANNTTVNGMNNVGQLVGIYTLPNDFTVYSFVWQGGVFTTLSDGNFELLAYGINDSGEIVGSAADNTGGYGFLYSQETYTTFQVNASSTAARAINNAGQIAGTLATSFAGYEGFYLDHVGGTPVAINSHKKLTQPFGINTDGVVVGFEGDYAGGNGFIWQNGTFSPTTLSCPSSNALTMATTINDSGEIAGWCARSAIRVGFLAFPLSSTQTN